MTNKRRSSGVFAGSQPEEQYAPATREKMFLDRPTSHGGWPEGEYDPPVRDRIYGWYKKMKMMPEGDDPTMRSVTSSEQRRDLQKSRYGRRTGYLSDPKSQEIAHNLALRIMSPEDRDAALDDVMQNPRLAMNVWSVLQSEGKYELAKLVRLIADEYVNPRGTPMRITESMLRRIIREEYSRLNEANDEAVKLCKSFRAKDFKTEAEMQSAKKKLASDLFAAGAKGKDAIRDALDGAGYGEDAATFAFELEGMQSMKESQRGNDQNSQHDNDTDPGDPYAKKLKESRRREIRKAVLSQLHRRGFI